MKLIAFVTASFFCMSAWAYGSDGADPLLKVDWGQWGLAGTVVGATMVLSWLREKRMAAAMDTQELWIRNELITVLKRVADAPCQKQRED